MLTRGSEWRRWDLHVHTPDTALNDQFGDWDEYINSINAQDQVRVVGVTDYFLIDNYGKLKQAYRDGKLPKIDLLVPNIEFRIAPPSDKATALNIHLLVSPDDPDHEKKIHYALARLSWKYSSSIFSCQRDQLIALGKAFDDKVTEDHKALTVGVTQFKIDFSAFRDWYDKETWLKANSLIVVSAGKDGLSGFQKDGQWGGYREEITRFSNALFSGRPGERDFWLCRCTEEDKETIMKLGGMKPCLHGSDAHRIADMFRVDQDRFCWVKADTSFDGLKQVLYEPESRVHIGPTPPLYHDEARVIRTIRLSGSGGWFDDIEIPLNPGLVSIIGQKGSGKSALAELAAFTAGSWDTAESGSFLRRAGSHLEGMQITLEWGNDDVSTVTLGEPQPESIAVRYLSQKFVERLCADDSLGNELIEEIEKVIFAYIEPSDTLNASSFEELRTMLTSGTRAEGQRIQEDIKRLIQEECDLRNNAAKLSDKKNRVKALAEERKGLEKQLPKAASPEEEKTQKELQEKRKAVAALQKEAGEDKQKLQKINDIRTSLSSMLSRMNKFYSDITLDLREVGVTTDETAAFKPVFSGDVEKPLTRCEKELSERIVKREGAEANPAPGTIRSIEAQIAELAKKESVDKARAKRIQDIQKRISDIDSEVGRIQKEVEQIEGPEKARITTSASERMVAYTDYFKNLKNEQTTLAKLYAPVSKKLKSEAAFAQEQDLEFSIRWEVNLEAWIERGSSLFDHRRNIPYGTIERLREAAKKILVPSWASGDPDKIQPAMEEFLNAFRDKALPPSKYLRSGVNIQDIFEWIYETDHIHLSYGLKYNGTDLDKLSPGTKGIVLLILYLGMDVGDSRPLIVDQPDENLDNESIYELLTEYFKMAKARRQIILITHNPNLVVNADSEQVIVASCKRQENGLPYIRYESGALENPDIRKQVCRILEGGTDAFRKREKRYSLPA